MYRNTEKKLDKIRHLCIAFYAYRLFSSKWSRTELAPLYTQRSPPRRYDNIANNAPRHPRNMSRTPLLSSYGDDYLYG